MESPVPASLISCLPVVWKHADVITVVSFVDYSDLLDELICPQRQEDLNKYRKRIRYYARIQLLFIDDFVSADTPRKDQDPVPSH